MSEKNKAVIFMLVSTFSLSLTQAIVKYLEYPIYEEIFFRNVIGIPIMMLLLKKGDYKVPKQYRLKLSFRLIFGLTGMFLYYYSIQYMDLADATMINKLNVFFVMMFAYLFLKEQMTKRKITALIFAVIGAFFVIKPGFQIQTLNTGVSIVAVLGAAFAGLAYTMLRTLRGLSSKTVVFYFSSFNAIITFGLFLVNPVLPTRFDLLLFVILGLSATLGQYTLTLAYSHAEASKISIYNFTSIIFAIFFGMFLFGVLPDSLSLLGGILIFFGAWINTKTKTIQSSL